MSKTKIDPKELKEQIEAEEREATIAFEAKLKEQREKKMASVIEPLRKERNELAQTVNEANTRIKELDGQIADLTGTKLRERKAGGKRRRLTEESKLKLADIIYNKMAASKKNRFKSSDLEQFTDGVKARELAELWNSKHTNAEKIHVEGKKSLTRYFVP